MKNKKLIFILLCMMFASLCIVIPQVLAGKVQYNEKSIYNIPSCYNTSFKVELLDGDYTGYSFKDCSIINKTWYCNCKDKTNYSIILRSEHGKVNYTARNWYKINISYNVYDIRTYKNEFMVWDYGSYYDVKYVTKKPIIQGFDCSMCGETIKYVNNTVYVDRPVQVIKEVPVEVIKEVPVYIQNCTVPTANGVDPKWWEIWR